VEDSLVTEGYRFTIVEIAVEVVRVTQAIAVQFV